MPVTSWLALVLCAAALCEDTLYARRNYWCADKFPLLFNEELQFSPVRGAKGIPGEKVVIHNDRIATTDFYESDSVFLYKNKNDVWDLEKSYMIDYDPRNAGSGVELTDDQLLVGSPWSSETYSLGGRVRTYVHNWLGWKSGPDVEPADFRDEYFFGSRLDIDGDTLVVGNQDQIVDGVYYTGSLDVFERGDDHEWNWVKHLTNSNNENYDELGLHVSVDGDWIATCTDSRDNKVFLSHRVDGVWGELEAFATGSTVSSVELSEGLMFIITLDDMLRAYQLGGAGWEEFASISFSGSHVDWSDIAYADGMLVFTTQSTGVSYGAGAVYELDEATGEFELLFVDFFYESTGPGEVCGLEGGEYLFGWSGYMKFSLFREPTTDFRRVVATLTGPSTMDVHFEDASGAVITDEVEFTIGFRECAAVASPRMNGDGTYSVTLDSIPSYMLVTDVMVTGDFLAYDSDYVTRYLVTRPNTPYVVYTEPFLAEYGRNALVAVTIQDADGSYLTDLDDIQVRECYQGSRRDAVAMNDTSYFFLYDVNDATDEYVCIYQGSKEFAIAMARVDLTYDPVAVFAVVADVGSGAHAGFDLSFFLTRVDNDAIPYELSITAAVVRDGVSTEIAPVWDAASDMYVASGVALPEAGDYTLVVQQERNSPLHGVEFTVF
eukprot:gnl/Chilomastix_cuspidata/690.p1 GENE.gnl/Chilomastix_cuspidata/690~~gnl/Chilomastix_cuspidata/690.p1  ORF type:complete len:663 (-),score=276.26 gnl/Chilomastix_cuspidata/690:562-2550(-)